MDKVYYEIRLDNGSAYFAAGDKKLSLKKGDRCVIQKDFYLDHGTIQKTLNGIPDAPLSCAGSEITTKVTAPSDPSEFPQILRKANGDDLIKIAECRQNAQNALNTTRSHVESLKLPMKLINAHFALDGKLLSIQFSADGRIDFRELVKILSKEFNTRIELRQIGVRDETAVLGGISLCGRPLCCCVFLNDFASINVKMAKDQDLALTSTSISGICGRLKCCLKYEHEGYLALDAEMPRRGDCCECKEGRGRIIDRNLLTQKVVVQLDNSDRTITCDKSEVTVVYPDKYKIRGSKPDRGNTTGKPDVKQNKQDTKNDKQDKQERVKHFPQNSR